MGGLVTLDDLGGLRGLGDLGSLVGLGHLGNLGSEQPKPYTEPFYLVPNTSVIITD